eukprot:gene25321-28626_t
MISSFVPVTPGEVLMVMVGSTPGAAEGYQESAFGGDGGLNPTGGIPATADYSQVTIAPPGGNHLQEPTCMNKNPGPLGQGCDSPYWSGSGGGGGYYGGAAGQASGGGGGSSFSLYPIVIEATGVHTGDGYAELDLNNIVALIPGARIPQPAVTTASKGLHLSVTTGTPG